MMTLRRLIPFYNSKKKEKKKIRESLLELRKCLFLEFLIFSDKTANPFKVKF